MAMRFLSMVSTQRIIRATMIVLILSSTHCATPTQGFESPPTSPALLESTTNNPYRIGEINVAYTKSLLTVWVTGVMLEALLDEISKQTGIPIILHGAAQTPVSARFSKLPFGDAIRRLSKGYSHALIYAKNESGPPSLRPVVVLIYAPSTGGKTFYGQREPMVSEEPSLAGAAPPEVLVSPIDSLASRVYELDEAALTELIDLALYQGNETTRWEAIAALGGIGEARAMDTLIEGLSDDQTWVRVASVYAIAENGGQEALAVLETALNDPVPEVAMAAKSTIETLTGSKEGQLPLGEIPATDVAVK